MLRKRNTRWSPYQLPNFKALPSKVDYLAGPKSMQTTRRKILINGFLSRKTGETHNSILSGKMPRVLSAPPYIRSATKRSSKRKKSLLQKKSLKKMKTKSSHSGQLQRSRSELEDICATLGLRENLLQRLQSFSEDIKYHRSVKGWLLTFIENEYNDIEHSIEPQSSFKTKLSEKLLKELGFINPEVMHTIMKRSEQMQDHLDPIEFVKRYIDDEFKNNTVLPDSVREEASTLYGIDVNVQSFSEYRDDEQNEHCELRTLFHGTDLSSAENIMKNGIDIYFGEPKHDFSHGSGFYLTDDFEHAKTWAHSVTRKPVVIEFKIPISCLLEARRLNLDFSNEEKKSLWYQIVTEYRSGKPSRKLRQNLENYDCITGPVSFPLDDQSGGTRREPKPNSYQMCVVSEDMAGKIGKHAKYTLYTDRK